MKFHVPGAGGGRQTPAGFTRNDKRKLVLLGLGAVFVLVAFVALWSKSQAYEESAFDAPPVPSDVQETVDVPRIDVERLERLVHDGDPESRVVLETDALDALLADARTLTDRHFEALGTVELDAQAVAGILADPSAHRGEPGTVRGWIDDVRTRRRGADEEHLGRLVLEDGTPTYFVALRNPDDLKLGSFARFDGLFLKVFSDESEDGGAWLDGPLLVGPKLVRSYPALGEVTELTARAVAGVEDDVLFNEDGTQAQWQGIPTEALWHLMAYVRDLPEGAVDWEGAPELDRAMLQKLRTNGSVYRAQPFRIPLSRLQAIQIKRNGENPARIDFDTEGWIGNTMWSHVIHFRSPFRMPDLRMKDYVTARGFFLKNFAYPSSKEGVQVAPLFVMHSVERHVPSIGSGVMLVAWGMVSFVVISTVLLVVLVRRDKKHAAAFHEELVRRRRARRAARVGAPPDQSGAPST